jgi:hypothetical protein
MSFKNRKHQRFDCLNLLSYSCYDEKKRLVQQGMGRTLNVSQGGILLETHKPLDTSHKLALTIGFDDKLMDVKANIIYSRLGNDGKYESGLQFVETDEDSLRIMNQYIQAFLDQSKS